jgi:hypothetical protein
VIEPPPIQIENSELICPEKSIINKDIDVKLILRGKQREVIQEVPSTLIYNCMVFSYLGYNLPLQIILVPPNCKLIISWKHTLHPN